MWGYFLLYLPGLPPLLFRGLRPGVRDGLRSAAMDLRSPRAGLLGPRALSKGLVPLVPLRSGPLRPRSGREGRSRAEPNCCLDGRSGRRDSGRGRGGREENSRSPEAARRAGGSDTGRDGLRSPRAGLFGPRALSKGLVPLGPLRSGPPRPRSGREGRSRAEPNSCLDGRSGRRDSGRSWRGREKNSRSVEPARRAG